MKQGDVIVITGATSGIGLACARQFFKNGYRLSLAARSLDSLLEVQKELDPTGKRVTIVQADVGLQLDCKKIIDHTISVFGTIHVLMNNAGITMRALFKEVDLSVMHKIMEVNFWGAVHCTHYALPELLKNRGSVIGVSSVAGYKGLPTRTGYSASKFALEGFLETLRIENLRTGLHVLIARPGFTATNIRNTMMDAKGQSQGSSHKDEARSMTPEYVAEGIYKSVQKRKSYMLLSTTAILTFWLNKFFPAWVDRLVFRHVQKEKDSPLK